MATLHADAIVRSGRAQVAAVYAIDTQQVATFASRYGARVANDAREIFEDSAIGAVIIATPTPSHAEYLRLAHKAQKHVLCEKPVVRTRAEADEIAALFTGYPCVAAAGHLVRFTPEYKYLRQVIREGKLGQVGTIRLTRACGARKDPSDWHLDESASGGVILDLMVHDLDLLTWVFGPIQTIYVQRADHQGDLCHDYALAIAKLSSGALAHLEASWAEPPGEFYYAYEVAGSLGILEFDSRKEPTLVCVSRTDKQRVGRTPEVCSPVDAQLADFLDAIEKGQPPTVPLEVGLNAVRLALVALESAQSNQPIVVG
jgi:predicted dehydrogenase